LFTYDIEARLLEHNHGIKGYTMKKRPWTIVHTENFITKS